MEFSKVNSDATLVEIGGLTVLGSSRRLLMGCFLTYFHAFLEMLNDGLPDGGEGHE